MSHLHRTNELTSCMSHCIWSFAAVKERQAGDSTDVKVLGILDVIKTFFTVWLRDLTVRVDVRPKLPMKSVLTQRNRSEIHLIFDKKTKYPSTAAGTHLTVFVIASVNLCRSHGLMPCCNVNLM